MKRKAVKVPTVQNIDRFYQIAEKKDNKQKQNETRDNVKASLRDHCKQR